LTANLSASYERRGQANESFVLSQQVVNVPSPDTDLFDGDVAQAIAVRAVEVDSGTGVDVVVANLRVAYQLARRTSLYASVGWREQSFTGDASAVGSADRLSLNVGFNYSFEPVNF
jgi:hypothetical protein